MADLPAKFVSVREVVQERGAAQARIDLYHGRLQAFRRDRALEDLEEIPAKDWGRPDAIVQLQTGRCLAPDMRVWEVVVWADWRDAIEPISPSRDDAATARPSEAAQDTPPAAGDFNPEFMELMKAAIREFKISEEHVPKKEIVKNWFLKQKLPDGTPVSDNQAEALASFCRPARSIRGGNKRSW